MKKNILIIVPSLRLGGQERVAVNDAEILSKEHNVTLLIFDSEGKSYKTDVNTINIDVPSKPGALFKIRNVIQRVRRVNKIKKKERLDAVISFGPPANLINILSGNNGKKIISLRSSADCHFNSYEKVLYPKADAIICVAEAMKGLLLESHPELKEKVYAIQNPYNINSLKKLGKEKVEDYDFSKNTIVCHARLNEAKNFPRLIKAIRILKKQISDVQLLIIGEGEERGRLEQLINRYNLEKDISLIGFRENPFAYISKSQLYVLPSYYEGFPNSLVEGMVFLPAIAVDCPTGPNEIMNGEFINDQIKGFKRAKYGYLVEPAKSREYNENITEDDIILAEALKHALSDESFMSSNSIERVEELSFENHSDKMNAILDSVIGK